MSVSGCSSGLPPRRSWPASSRTASLRRDRDRDEVALAALPHAAPGGNAAVLLPAKGRIRGRLRALDRPAPGGRVRRVAATGRGKQARGAALTTMPELVDALVDEIDTSRPY